MSGMSSAKGAKGGKPVQEAEPQPLTADQIVAASDQHRILGGPDADPEHHLAVVFDQAMAELPLNDSLVVVVQTMLSNGIGSQSQRPLAIVVVGGMLATLLLMNLAPVLYSFYGKRTPPAGAGDMGH